ncbi:MAG: FeoB small GTPase domain-containing protein [Pyrinomonadaceae bacterium]
MTAQAETTKKCGGCSSSGCNTAQLTKLGIKVRNWDYVVALAGNPNTGKSTIFNALTGLRQHVGNWAGKTVARAEGAFDNGGSKYKLVDLPGTYSLLSTSVDEEIARDFVLFGKPDVTVIVADATCLERSLHLVLQVLEITGSAVVALNLMDEAKRNGLTIDVRELTRELGVPVVPMAARRGEGVSELLAAIGNVASSKISVRPHQVRYEDEKLESAIGILAKQLRETFKDLPNARWVALRLLEGDESIINAIRTQSLGGIRTQTYLPQLEVSEAR